jgi:hypothetical protein
MTNNQQILEKAISKAIDGGWQMSFKPEEIETLVKAPSSFIYSHDFAKALWPNPMIITEDQYEELSNGKVVKTEDTKEWGLPSPMYKYHLMQMVIADDPIKYLGENI